MRENITGFLLSSQGSSRRLYDILIERVFRDEEKRNDSRVGKSDIDALEKEVSIDIADLRSEKKVRSWWR